MKKSILIVLLLSFLSLETACGYSFKSGFKFGMECADYGISGTQIILSLSRLKNAGGNSPADATFLKGVFDQYKGLRDYEQYGDFLLLYGSYLTLQGNFNEAIKYNNQAADFWKDAKGEKNENYLCAMLGIANDYVRKRDFFAAREYLSQVEDAAKKNKTLEPLIKTIEAQLLYQDGKVKDALDVLNSIKNRSEGIEHTILSYRLANGEKEKVIDELKNRRAKMKKIEGVDISYLNTLAVLLSQNQSTIDEAIDIEDDILQHYRDFGLTQSPEYGTYLMNMAVMQNRKGDNQKAVNYGERALTAASVYAQSQPVEYGRILKEQARLCFENGDTARAALLARVNFSNAKRDIGINLLRSADQRRNYWSNSGQWFISTFPSIALGAKDTTTLQAAYESLLVGKGMLTYSENVFGELAAAAGGQTQESYNEYIDLTNRLKNETDIKEYERLNNRKDELFYEFAKTAKDNPDFNSYFSFSWRDVEDALSEDECAVEFFEYKKVDGSNHYGAMVLIANDTVPKIRYICAEDDLKGIKTKSVDANLKKVWTPLSDLISDKNQVYFSAAGRLHVLPIEYATPREGMKMKRLTSTRVLSTKRRPENTIKDMVLYGGLTYRMTDNSMKNESGKYPKSRTRGDIVFERQGAAASIEPLENTLYEVEGIADILTPKLQTAPRLLTGNEGIEESFKAMSGKSPEILHVATHGFFFDRKEESSGLPEWMRLEAARLSSAEQMMRRSGLLLSGANKAFAENIVTEGVDDGILTSSEISELNLADTRLAVLSACETGLGEISGNGVEGLQSAFKQAGVDQMLISLWKVDDEATSRLMKEFYNNWIIKGKDKSDALELAMESIRNDTSHPEWKDSQYWGAFILLDNVK